MKGSKILHSFGIATQSPTREGFYNPFIFSIRNYYIAMYCVLGTTTAECKSGYGLDVQNEVKMLRGLEKAKKELPIEISSTFCGAHSVPK